jgi:hypothetical protein
MIRGSLTDGESPCLVKISDLLIPKAFILTSTQPGFTFGIGTSLTANSCAVQGFSNTTAFILKSLLSYNLGV